jgi:uncharacterized membrane protein
MADGNPRSTAQIAGHPIHPMLIPFPVAFLVATLASDVAFWSTGNVFWAIGSMWLLGAALVMAALAALAGVTDFLGERRIRNIADAWLHMIGNVIAVLLSPINLYLRYANGAEAGVFPWGIWISLIVVLLLMFNGWKGWELVYKHRVGIADAPPDLPNK